MSRHFTLFLLLFSLIATATIRADSRPDPLCQSQGLSASPEDNEFVPGFTRFGASVTTSGNTAMVGLPDYFREPERQDGRVAVFTCDSETRTWVRTGSIDVRNQPESEFGFGSSVSLQGRRAAIGSLNAIRLYERSQHGWQRIFELTANGEDEIIGPKVVFDGTYFAFFRTRIVGGEARTSIDVYRASKRAKPKLAARLRPIEDFGEPILDTDSLAMHDGTVVEGVHVYSKRRGGWRPEQRLTPVDESGQPVGLSEVTVYRDTILGGNPFEDMVTDESGAFGGGAVYVFQRLGDSWHQVQRIRPDPGNFNGFGGTLAFNGELAAMGTPIPYGALQVDWGPMFLYRFTPEGFVFDRTMGGIASSIDASSRYLIWGTDIFVHAPVNSAHIALLE